MSFNWSCHFGHNGKSNALLVQLFDKSLVVKPCIGADSKVLGMRQERNCFLEKRNNTFGCMGVTVAEKSSDNIFEMGFGSNQRMIGFFTDVSWVVTFDDAFLMTVKSVGCGIEINAVAGPH